MKLGLWLQFSDKVEFVAHLEQKGIKFANDKHRQELLKTLKDKWDLMKDH